MPKRVEEYKGYRIAIYTPQDHYAVVTAPGRNAVIDFRSRRPTSTSQEGADACVHPAQRPALSQQQRKVGACEGDPIKCALSHLGDGQLVQGSIRWIFKTRDHQRLTRGVEELFRDAVKHPCVAFVEQPHQGLDGIRLMPNKTSNLNNVGISSDED